MIPTAVYIYSEFILNDLSFEVTKTLLVTAACVFKSRIKMGLSAPTITRCHLAGPLIFPGSQRANMAVHGESL